MNMMRRLFRLAPIMVLPLIKFNTIYMTKIDPPSAPQMEVFVEGHLKQHMENINSSSQQPKQKQKEEVSITSQIKYEEQKNGSVIQSQSEIKQQIPHATESTTQQQSKKQQNIAENNIQLQQLKQNEAIVHQSCPLHIISYLYKVNYKIYRTDDPSCKLKLKNKKGDTFAVNFDQIASGRKDEMALIANFINPPIELTTVDEAKKLIKGQQKDNFFIFTYLPNQQDYDRLIQSRTKSIFDNFTTTRKADLYELQQAFTSLAYNSSSNKNSYLIVRTKEVADYLRVNSFNIGVPYILNKTTRQSGNQSNNQFEGSRYHLINLAKQWKDHNNKQQWKAPLNRELINHLTHFYINKVESEAQAFNKIRQMQMSGDKRKLLLVYTNQKRQQFHDQLDEVLQKVARTQKDNIVVVKTQNQQILKQLFKVESDFFTTIRLFNLNQQQTPIFKSKSNESYHYSRSKLKGPFKYQNICNFVNSKEWQEYYQSKRKLTYIKPVGPQELRKLDKTLVLLEKQGCQGCKYLEETLDQLKKVTKALASNSKFKRNLIYRYKLEDSACLTTLKIRRYSIFNESQSFTPPTTTPKLFMFSQGKMLDLRVDQSLGKIKQVKSDIQAEMVHDLVLSDIINKIRKSDQQVFSEF